MSPVAIVLRWLLFRTLPSGGSGSTSGSGGDRRAMWEARCESQALCRSLIQKLKRTL